MGKIKEPNWRTGVGRYGRYWTAALRKAQEAGAVISVEETGVPVTYDRYKTGVVVRPWVDDDGNRYDSRDCVPVF